jgi:phage terminase large subunit-like protein
VQPAGPGPDHRAAAGPDSSLVTAPPVWSTACPDWAERLVAGRSIIPPPIFPDQAAQAVDVFKALRVVDLPGRPTFGECCGQWVFDFVGAIFGAYDAETGNQLIREFYLLISKKNTKSTIAAGIMVTAVILCWREDEEHLILAPTKEVADNSFRPAAGMVRADDELADLFHVQDHVRTITHRVTRASLKVVAADTDTVSGKKSGRILVDEHWLFGTKADANGMFMEATGGQISRNEGWVIYLTTQSDQPPAGVFAEKLDYYRQVRDGTIVDPGSLGVLYEFPPEMVEAKSYMDPANFYVTNPNIGRSISPGWLADNLRKQAAKTDGSFQKFIAKHLNVQIGLSLTGGRWAGAEHWEENTIPAFTLPELFTRCEVVTVGIDGGGLDDLLGLCVMGRETATGCWLVWSHAWAHQIALERNTSEASRFIDFQRDGDLTIIPKPGADVEGVADIVEQCEESGLLDRIGVDQAGIQAIVKAITDRGIELERIVGISQGWRLNGSIKTCERRLAGGDLKHGGTRLMAYAVSNARAERRGNAVTITKQASGNLKIDPLSALFDAAALMADDPKPRSRKYQMMVV